MNRLDPNALFERLSSDIPADLHDNVLVTGSLAAAYEYRAALEGNAVNTKDADLVVHPAGEEVKCATMTQKLLTLGWRRTPECYPQTGPTPPDRLRAIRLYPPESEEYFIEFLNVPQADQAEAKSWVPIQVADGWYGLPSFRYLAVVAIAPKSSDFGIRYARPSMMALANLLAHPILGDSRIESGAMKGLLRSAKDLGRVIALAYLSGRDETEENWSGDWIEAIKSCFPDNAIELSRTLGDGLQELINNASALQDAYKTTDIGLLSGRSVSPTSLVANAERLLADVVQPVETHFDYGDKAPAKSSR